MSFTVWQKRANEVLKVADFPIPLIKMEIMNNETDKLPKNAAECFKTNMKIYLTFRSKRANMVVKFENFQLEYHLAGRPTTGAQRHGRMKKDPKTTNSRAVNPVGMKKGRICMAQNFYRHAVGR